MDEAKSIASFVIEKRLAAGVNIFPEVHSIYHWQGKIENSCECVCIFKTMQENYAKLEKIILEKHSYVTPCIVALPVNGAHADFAKWVQDETKF